MTVSLSIKDVPDALAAKLRARAARNHRSLQRELMAIVEAAALEHAGRPALAQTTAAPAFTATRAAEAAMAPGDGKTDGLLSELDAIVADSCWGAAPVLSREQAHDRRLQRELDYEARRAEATPSKS